ncbi:MAG TPA: hypothetical protein VJ870_11290 [Amycolatopsis sp.]|nr:hypothetical protein [Amycolatopsis sp.]
MARPKKTNAEQATGTDDSWYDRAKQVAVARALADMLAAADAAEVPPLRWTVNLAGWSLYGEIDSPFDPNPQATFDAWVSYLGLRRHRSGDRAGGTCPTNRDVPVGIHNPEHH